MNMPRIAVVGTGAMGSVYAGLFAEAGYQTSVVDLWQEHMTAIGKTGLHLEGMVLAQLVLWQPLLLNTWVHVMWLSQT